MTELRAFRYRLPMRPIRLAGRVMTERTGLVLCDAATGQHWGEAAPLPYFSRESLDDVISAWRVGPPYELPSLRFAADAIQYSCTRALECRGPGPSDKVPVNGLISGSEQDVVHAAQRFGRCRHLAIKLKVGPQLGTVTQCAQTVMRVRAALRPDQTLRLDANRSWPLAEAIQFGKLLPPSSIEYCEEPTDSPLDLETFLAETGMPYALDETIRERTDLDLFPHATALVVKPMIHGNREDLQPLRRFGIPLVFSGTFETGLGTLHVARLAHEFSPQTPAGIDSYSWLLDDIVTPRLALHDGWLDLRGEVMLERRLLEELAI
jgi:O-succinylbenzoate synthase